MDDAEDNAAEAAELLQAAVAAPATGFCLGWEVEKRWDRRVGVCLRGPGVLVAVVGTTVCGTADVGVDECCTERAVASV